ncbi:MAG: protein kinase, partial [Myxococcota bacterium]
HSAHEEGTERPLLLRSLPRAANGEAVAQAMRELPRHVALPRVLEVHEGSERIDIVIDSPVGTPLGDALGEPLPLPSMLMLGAELASALSVLHDHGVVHGALFAEAVRILPTGRALLWSVPLLLVDRLADRRSKDRESWWVWSTAPFLSNERIRSTLFSPAADTFALGVLLCLAAGGSGPSTLPALQTLHDIARSGWKPRVPRRLPKRVRSVLQRMTHADALERPHAGVVYHALCAAQKGAEVPKNAWLARLDGRWRTYAHAGLVAVLVTLVVALWWRPDVFGARGIVPEPVVSPSATVAGWCGPAPLPALPAAPQPTASPPHTSMSPQVAAPEKPTSARVQVKRASSKKKRPASRQARKKPPREEPGFFASLFGGD